MNSKEHLDEWAWERIEAATDGSLSIEQQRRFEAALAEDLDLQAATARARRLHDELRRLAPAQVPRGLLSRLWSIPTPNRETPSQRRTRSGPSLLFAAPAAALCVIVIAGVLFIQQQYAEPDPREVAVQQFVIAMNYLQQGAEFASQEVQGQVQNGISDALILSRESLLERNTDSENGG